MKQKVDPKVEELFYAINTNDLASAKKLIEQDLDVTARDKGDSTPLMRAAVNGNHEIAKVLLDHGADVNIQDQRGWTALHFAAQKYDEAVTRLLLERGANANAQDSYGNTPLCRAVFNCRGDNGGVIRLLLSGGADPTIENQSGISALKLAQTISNYDVKQFFT